MFDDGGVVEQLCDDYDCESDEPLCVNGGDEQSEQQVGDDNVALQVELQGECIQLLAVQVGLQFGLDHD